MNALDSAGARRDPPCRVLADIRRFLEEVEHRIAGQLHLAAPPRREQLGPADAEFLRFYD